MKAKQLTYLMTLAFATTEFVNATTFTGGDISDAGNWDDGAPTIGNAGTIAVDGNWPTTTSTISGWDITQTAGTITVVGGRTYNSGGIYSLSGGTLDTSAGNFTFAGGAVFNQSGGTFTGNNFFIDNTGGAYNITGGTAIFENLQNRFQGLINFNAGAGSVTTDSFGMTGGVSRVLFASGSKASFIIGAAPTFGNTANHFNFEDGSQASLTITGFTATDFENLWTTGSRLRFDGGNTGTFSEHFQVSGSTLTVIPEPGTLALFGLAGLALAISQRRRRN
ncbi:MAG: PEP-CTERM sorting domain-containing protein [Verrucomicrobia bacterium]|nr:PEP-CTERM sorting domain-containing protein [Verrucomicrobiota bacterium]MCH8527893.1 PEP-CTERM sorting domain-containing protein [Kiritimatiellia bacterium]